MIDDPDIFTEDQDITGIVEENGLTAETEDLIQDHADELIDDIDNFDEDVQIAILENL